MQSLKSIHHPEHGLPAVLVEQTPGLPTLPHMAPAPGSGKHYHSPMPVSIGRAQTLLPAHLCAILQGPILQPQEHRTTEVRTADWREPRARSQGPDPWQGCDVQRQRSPGRGKQTKALGTKAGYISGLEACGLDNGSPLCWGPGCLEGEVSQAILQLCQLRGLRPWAIRLPCQGLSFLNHPRRYHSPQGGGSQRDESKGWVGHGSE